MIKRSDKCLIFSVFIMMVIPTGVASAAVPPAPQGKKQTASPAPPSGPLELGVDPRIELLAVVQLLSGYERYGLLNSYDTPYRRAVENHFTPHRSHAAVQTFTALAADGFTFDAPIKMMLHLSPPPELALRLPFSEEIIRRAGGHDALDQFVRSLRDFSQVTSFGAFFEAYGEWFEERVRASRTGLQGKNYLGLLEDYYGQKQHSYAMILAPLLEGGFAAMLARPDSDFDVRVVMGPIRIEDGHLTFGASAHFRWWIWHEFGHSFVDPLKERYWDEIQRSEALFAPIADSMQRLGYGDWPNIVEEHIVRAVTIRLTERVVGAQAGEGLLRYEKDQGFAYIESLLNQLREYEDQRDRYRTFTDFFPNLLGALRQYHPENGDTRR